MGFQSQHRIGLVGVLVFLLWIIRDHDRTVVSAVQIHEPSLRIFRSMLELNLVVFGAALSIWVWKKIASDSKIKELMFESIDPSTVAEYESAAVEDDQEDKVESDTTLEQEPLGEPPKENLIPSPAEISKTSLNMLILTLIALFLYTITTFEYLEHLGGGSWKTISRIAAPTFPLVLFLYFTYKAFFPWKKRGVFWIVVSLTVASPWAPVTFRDGFIGDVLTSSVRPMQDVAFTIVYLFSGLRGYWSKHDYEDFIHSADATLERSWMLHTVVLPCCMVSPLWWRFLQNLRQCYEERKRWPYLGNALKYFLAAQVAVLGVFQPTHKKKAWWIMSFLIATLYQVWWDIYMDWNLLNKYKLRKRRLYNSESFYWAIAFVNFLLRFCSTLTFLPPRYLSAGGILNDTFAGGPVIASLEIIRRTLWGLLRFEWEVIKETNDAIVDQSNIELTPMKMMDDIGTPSKDTGIFTSNMSGMNDVQILGELALYAATFGILGFIAAAHRETA